MGLSDFFKGRHAVAIGAVEAVVRDTATSGLQKPETEQVGDPEWEEPQPILDREKDYEGLVLLYGKEEAERTFARQESDLRAQRAARVRGKHYSAWTADILSAARDGRQDDALKVLAECMDAAEAESVETSQTLAPWPYERAGIIFRKAGNFAAEVEVLERYVKHPEGRVPKIAARLAKARTLLTTQKAAETAR